jgi:hypothetical protein
LRGKASEASPLGERESARAASPCALYGSKRQVVGHGTQSPNSFELLAVVASGMLEPAGVVALQDQCHDVSGSRCTLAGTCSTSMLEVGALVRLHETGTEEVQSILREVRAILRASRHLKVQAAVERINPIVRGWANYFRHGNSSRALGSVKYGKVRRFAARQPVHKGFGFGAMEKLVRRNRRKQIGCSYTPPRRPPTLP